MRYLLLAIFLALIGVYVFAISRALHQCGYVVALSVQLDKADTAIFDSMMECKPHCGLEKYEQIWGARQELYDAWREGAVQCLG